MEKEKIIGVSGNWSVPPWNDGIGSSRAGAEGIELGYKSMWIFADSTIELLMMIFELPIELEEGNTFGIFV